MDVDGDLMACAGCLCLASRRAARSITAAFERSLRPHGIRATQFTTLVMLMLRGPTPIGELAESLGMERTTLSRNLDLLEAKGWAESRPGADDSRARVARVTAEGQVVVRAALPQWRQAQDAVAQAVGDPGVDALRRLAQATIR